jgi:hypothetical protein
MVLVKFNIPWLAKMSRKKIPVFSLSGPSRNLEHSPGRVAVVDDDGPVVIQGLESI